MPVETLAPLFYTNHKCGRCCGKLHGMYGIPKPGFDANVLLYSHRAMVTWVITKIAYIWQKATTHFRVVRSVSTLNLQSKFLLFIFSSYARNRLLDRDINCISACSQACRCLGISNTSIHREIHVAVARRKRVAHSYFQCIQLFTTHHREWTHCGKANLKSTVFLVMKKDIAL